MAEATDVTEASLGELGEFGVHLGSRIEAELIGVTQPATHVREHLPVRTAFPEAKAVGRTEGHTPLGIGHGAGLLTPLGSWQQQVGVVGRF